MKFGELEEGLQQFDKALAAQNTLNTQKKETGSKQKKFLAVGIASGIAAGVGLGVTFAGAMDNTGAVAAGATGLLTLAIYSIYKAIKAEMELSTIDAQLSEKSDMKRGVKQDLREKGVYVSDRHTSFIEERIQGMRVQAQGPMRSMKFKQ